MQEAIQTGDPYAVEALLNRISDRTQAVKQVTTTYGGRSRGNADGNGLFEDTYPILHTAFGASPSMFWVVLDAMRKLMTSSQVWYRIRIDGDSSRGAGG